MEDTELVLEKTKPLIGAIKRTCPCMSVSRRDGTSVELRNLALAPAVSFLNRRLLQVGVTATMITPKRLRVLLEKDHLLDCSQWAVSIRGFGFSARSYFITYFRCCFFET